MADHADSGTAPSEPGRGRRVGPGAPPAVPPAPERARGFFGSRLPLVDSYVRLLAGPGVERGLLGPREVSRIWERHVLNSAVVGELISPYSTVVDVGSGAGLPGIVLAVGRPDLEITLLDAALRRVVFLEECVEALGLGSRVRILRGRVEDVARDIEVDTATARAVAPLDRLARWVLPMLRPGGQLLAMKGEKADDELARARPLLDELRVRDAAVLRAGEGVADPPATVVRIIAGSPRPRRRTRRR